VDLQPGLAGIAARLGLPVVPVATDSGRHWARGVLGKFPGPIHIVIGKPIPACLPREDLFSALEMFWRRAEAAGFRLVDNSVEQIDSQFAKTPSDHR